MTASVHHSRAALGLVFGVGLGCLALHVPAARACDAKAMVEAARRGASCEVILFDSPFARHPDNPQVVKPESWLANDTGMDCFAVAHDGTSYVLLTTAFANPGSYPNGFYMIETTDPTSWPALGTTPAFPGNTSWFGNLKCPEPAFRDGLMHLYFRGGPGAMGDEGIGHATSDDGGQSWDITNRPVLERDQDWELYVDMPSVVQLPDGSFVMAYCSAQTFEVPSFFATGIAFSDDGIIWTKHDDNPVVVPTPGTWHFAVAGRPRLVVGDDGLLHMFWTGGAEANRCWKIGYAVSPDGGQTWVQQIDPVFDMAESGWDDGGVWCTSFVRPPAGDRIEMFYGGIQNGTGVKAYGLAIAPWPLQGVVAIDPSAAAPLVHAVTLAARPNPFGPRTSLVLTGDVTGALDVAVFDVSGRRVRTLITSGGGLEGAVDVARVSWDGLGDDGRDVPPGRYLVRVSRAGDVLSTANVTRVR